MSVMPQVHGRGYRKMHSTLIGGRGSRSSSLELYLAPRETPDANLGETWSREAEKRSSWFPSTAMTYINVI